MRFNVLSVSLLLIACGVLTQALLAGFFLSGTSEARMTHVIIGAVLPYLAIVPTVAAWRRAGRQEVSRIVAIGATLLLIGLWVQEALGHMPWPMTTVIHVPLGVLLFWLSFQLSYSVLRQSPERSVPSPGVTSPDS